MSIERVDYYSDEEYEQALLCAEQQAIEDSKKEAYLLGLQEKQARIDTYDNACAYVINNPIRTVEDLGCKLITKPLSTERVEFFKHKWFYHEKNEFEDKNMCNFWDSKIFVLRDKLLSFGGSEACMDGTEPDLEEILNRGQLWLGDKTDFVEGEPSRCHQNSAKHFFEHQEDVVMCTGYALSDDGIWRQHSWCVSFGKETRIVETTTPRIAYFGFVLLDEEAMLRFRSYYY